MSVPDFKTGNFIMHIESADHCFEILSIDKHMDMNQIKVRCFNLGYMGRPFSPDTDAEIIYIHAVNLKNWVQMDVEELVVPRMRTGLPAKYRALT